MTKKQFLALGECMVELAPVDGDLFRMGYAGDTFNTAWYARQLLGSDWTVSYGTCVGQDAASQGMMDFMSSENIDVSTIRQLPDRTVGLYSIQLEDGERSFSYWRGQSAAKLLADDTAWLDGILSDANVIHFSGITLAILSPEARLAFCAAVAKARAAGSYVAFDTNLRPKLWEDEATMKAGLEMGASVADCVLPSFDEEEGLFGDASPEETIKRYRATGAQVIAVKNGGDALTLWTEESGIQTFQPLSVSPVDTTAAGDSFGAGLVCALCTEQSSAAAAQQAMTMAAKVIQARGAIVRDIF